MRNFVLFSALMMAGFSVAAQQQPPRPSASDKPAAATPKKGDSKDDSNFEKRIRTEGAAGGTAPVPKEAREGVGAGAKPHMHADQLDRGLHRRSDAEVIAPPR